VTMDDTAVLTEDGQDDDDISFDQRIQEQLAFQKVKEKGIRVVSAFEGYAFDYGLRVGDKLVAVDNIQIEAGTTSIEQVRNTLRGEPGTLVTIAFERDGVEGVQSVTMPRAVVKTRRTESARCKDSCWICEAIPVDS
jgi:C-terminal processing protease CtpA/Prc